MDLLERLNYVNDVKILSVLDREAFKSYGRVINTYDVSDLIRYMEEYTENPENGNIYVPSVPVMEKMPIRQQFENLVYGGMPIEIGYCNGRNTTFNGFEYHKGSEINIAVTDFCLCLGHVWDIEHNEYSVNQVQVFFVPKGTVLEMYQTTLHLSPCRVNDIGFKDIVILPRGTNTALNKEAVLDEESRLLLMKNKWVIAHPEREPLMKQGAVGGVMGPNKEVKY